MTYEQKVKNNKKRISQQKILDFIKSPKTYYEIHLATGLSEAHIRQLLVDMPNNWRNGDMVKGRYHKMVKTFYAISTEIADYVEENHEGTVYRMMDDPKYHANMKLLRDNRKPLEVSVSGTSLSGF
jgi:hypothetical protein